MKHVKTLKNRKLYWFCINDGVSVQMHIVLHPLQSPGVDSDDMKNVLYTWLHFIYY